MIGKQKVADILVTIYSNNISPIYTRSYCCVDFFFFGGLWGLWEKNAAAGSGQTATSFKQELDHITPPAAVCVVQVLVLRKGMHNYSLCRTPPPPPLP